MLSPVVEQRLRAAEPRPAWPRRLLSRKGRREVIFSSVTVSVCLFPFPLSPLLYTAASCTRALLMPTLCAICSLQQRLPLTHNAAPSSSRARPGVVPLTVPSFRLLLQTWHTAAIASSAIPYPLALFFGVCLLSALCSLCRVLIGLFPTSRKTHTTNPQKPLALSKHDRWFIQK